jgi:hypothetical protein
MIGKKIKPFERKVISIETYDIDRAVTNAGENQFQLILLGAVIARKLAAEDLKAENASGQIQVGQKPVVRAIQQIAAGLHL